MKRTPRNRIDTLCKNVPTFPVNQQGFQVRGLCWAATHGMHLDYTKNLCKSTFDSRVIANTLSRNSSTCDTKSLRWGCCTHQRRETCGKRGRTNWKHNCNADTCKNTADFESFCSCGCSTEFYGWVAKTSDIGTSTWQESEDHKRSELQFDKFRTPSTYLCFKIGFKNQVTACSNFPSEAMSWIKEVEMVDSLEELKSSRSIAGKNCPTFEMFDARIACALN